MIMTIGNNMIVKGYGDIAHANIHRDIETVQ